MTLNVPIKFTAITFEKRSKGSGPSRPMTRSAVAMPAQLIAPCSRAERLRCQIHRALNLRAVGDVGLREPNGGADLARQLVSAIADVANDDVCAGPRELHNAGRSQTGAPAGNDKCLSL